MSRHRMYQKCPSLGGTHPPPRSTNGLYNTDPGVDLLLVSVAQEDKIRNHPTCYVQEPAMQLSRGSLLVV
jgi:hypothetical protein